MSDRPVHITLATAPNPGAVAIIELHGAPVAPLLERLTGKTDWPPGRLRLADFAGIDQGLAVRLNEHRAQVMPHGGPRVTQKVIDALLDRGGQYVAEPDPGDRYPEAASPIEADVMQAVAEAASPAAINLLAKQPAAWRTAMRAQTRHSVPPTTASADMAATSGGPSSNERAAEHSPASPIPAPDREQARALLARSEVLDRLISPPTVVVLGRPNVGKSTLTNTLLGKRVSLVADLPGTTRDWVRGLAELNVEGRMSSDEAADNSKTSDISHQPSAISHSVAVRWLDTPGLHVTENMLEHSAIALARQALEQAEVLIAMRDPDTDWPEATALPRRPDLWVVNKRDRDAEDQPPPGHGGGPEQPLAISAAEGRGLRALERAVIEALGLDAIRPDQLWAFSPTLRQWLGGQGKDLHSYLSETKA